MVGGRRASLGGGNCEILAKTLTVTAGERPMHDNMLSGIIFGCRTCESDKQMVRDWVESVGRPVRFYQAFQRDGAFALDIQEID